MSIEAGVVLGPGGVPIHWHLPGDRSGGALPDSRDLWDVLWEYRKVITGFAHSHPGSGEPWYSQTDVTTFAAVEAALGCRLDWWIITSDGVELFRWRGPERLDYIACGWERPRVPKERWTDGWVEKLRDHSGYPTSGEEVEVDGEAAIRADERRKVLDAVRGWARDLHYAPLRAVDGGSEEGLRSAFGYVKDFLCEEALKKYL